MLGSEEVKDAHWKAAAIENKPTWVLPSPFNSDGPMALTVFELAMYELSWTLRSKPEWQRKASDPDIRRKWRQEALEASVASDVPLTEKMVDYVLAELDGYARIADDERGIERGSFEAIWYSDRLIPGDVRERLQSAAKALENVPDEKKDWHPGSNKQVLDLVHPSLYCVVYGRTHAYLPGEPRIAANLLPVHPPETPAWTWESLISQDFAWMPSDLTVDTEGAVKLASPYINNLHPELHRPLYRSIEEVLTLFVPLFERVLGDSNSEKLQNAFGPYRGRLEDIGCIWGPGGMPEPEDENGISEKLLASIPKILPEAKEYTGQLEARFSPVSLRGRAMQCIIKLANIHLTPEQSEYEGGSWHVEGMVNESIVASGIYYYDEENISESKLSFRVSVGEPDYHGQDDNDCMAMLFHMEKDCDLVQNIGAVTTKAGRALAWPNLFQHRVSPFKLADPSNPGHRKILAVFLVNPTQDRVVSATDVPPQQAAWDAATAFAEAYACKGAIQTSRLGALPLELLDLIKGHFMSTPVMTLKEAEAYRLELMEERTAAVETHDQQYVETFNMCEH